MTVRAVSNNPASPFYVAAAPGLTGQAGSLTTLLDAVLVNGFSGFTALGWTIGQTTTSKRQYVMAASGSGYSLWVDDAAPATAKEARCAGYLTMSATTPTGTGQFPTAAQSAIGTGMLTIRKSTTADATNRYYTVVGDGHGFHLYTETGDFTSPLATYAFHFGDIIPYGASDTSYCLIMGRQVDNNNTVATSGSSGPGNIFQGLVQDAYPSLGVGYQSYNLTATIGGLYMAASYTNVGGSIAVGKHADGNKMMVNINPANANYHFQMGALTYWNSGGYGAYPNATMYPNGPDGGLYMSPIWIHHNGMIRGYIKGLFCPIHHMPLNHDDTFSGSGNLASRDFLVKNLVGVASSGPTAGLGAQCFIETTSGGWV